MKEKILYKQPKNSGIKPMSIELIETLKKNGFVQGKIPTDCQNIASLWLIEQMNILGSSISYYNQPLVMNICPTPGFEGYSSRGYLRMLPHTDLAWHEKPPKFIGMFCINPGEENECQTISDSCKVIDSLPQYMINLLRLSSIYFPPPKHVNSRGFTGTILNDNKLRINSKYIRGNWIEEAELFLQQLIKHEEKIYCQAGDFWFIDNEKYAHGRYQLSHNTKRHLLRVYGK